MRRLAFIACLFFGATVLIAATLVGYAYLNLAAIVDRNQQRVLAQLSSALGRPIKVEQIQVQPGWVVSLTVRGLKIGDDPTFSQEPFVVANQVAIHLKFWPLLRGRAKVVNVELTKPEVRVLRSASDVFNLETLGAAPAGKAPGLTALGVGSLTITDATVFYRDLLHRGVTTEIHHLDLHLANFGAYKPFEVALKLALLSDRQNVELSGHVGPLIRKRVVGASRVPLDLRLRLDQVGLDRLHALADFGFEIPSKLSMSGPLALSGTIRSEFGRPSFAGSAYLSSNRVRYGAVFDKAAGTAMVLAISGSRIETGVWAAGATLKLADLDFAARDVVIGKDQLGARIDTNSFDLATLTRAVSPIGAYQLFGKAEVHGAVKLVNERPDVDGIVTLSQAGAALPAGKIPVISAFTSRLEFAHNSVVIPQTDFILDGAHASVQGRADSIVPLSASYTFTADSVKLPHLIASRPTKEVVNRLSISGAAYGSFTAPSLNMAIASSDGRIAELVYRDLNLTALYADNRLSARPLKVAVFGGSLSANGDILFTARPQFDVALKMKGLNAEQLFRWRQLKAAQMLRGRLTGNVQLAGRGEDWKQIEPTLSGSGRLAIANGKLVGVNIVAVAINTLAGVPGISQLLNVAFMSTHRGMLIDPDTELTRASLSFDVQGRRIITHDLTAQSEFYSIRGDGWFDMDSNIDMSMDIQLTFGIAVALPVVVQGTWPSVVVLPDVPKLAERMAQSALSIPETILKRGAGVLQGLIP